jgi:diguanylate cyclase (GGDEF)-like protein/PAS domain S-box-containing protein
MNAISLRQMTKSQLIEQGRELRAALAKYRLLLDEASDPIFMFAPDGTYLYVNQAFATGVIRTQESIIGKRIWDVFSQEEADKRFAAVKWVFENKQVREIEVRVPRPDEDRFYLTTVKPVFDDHGQVSVVICISKEITERKKMETELRYLSTHDSLTGLYNRNFFETELRRFQESRFFPVSIIMIDLDHLKHVNDLFGHATGDEMIIRAAQVLKSAFRTEDIIARMGGDEFVVLLPKTDEAQVQDAVQRLKQQTHAQKLPLLTMSIGYACGTQDTLLYEVYRQADDAMYQDKAKHKLQERE